MSRASTDCPVVPPPSTSSRFPPFLEWPAEIRNAIYEELFEHDEPLRLGYPSKRHHFYDVGDDSDDDSDDIDCDTYRRSIPRGCRCPVPGVNLLATCHQVHAEATPVLYARNAFAVAEHHLTLGFMLRNWLDQIGSQQKFLKEIRCDDSAHWDVWQGVALVRLLWDYPSASFTITFTSFGRSSTKVASLSRMLAALSPAAQNPQLKAIMGSSRSLWEISIDREHPNSVLLKLKTDSQLGVKNFLPFHLPVLKYDMSSTGQLQRSFPQTPAPTVIDLTRLPLVMARLLEHMSDPQKDAVYDLDRHTMSRSLPAVLYVNRQLRYAFFELGTRKNHVATMSTSTSTADFTRAYANLRLWQTDFQNHALGRGRSRSATPYRSESVAIALNFRLAELKSLGDLRFDVACLVWASSSFCARTNIRVERFNNGIQVSQSQALCPNLYHLRRALLSFLTALSNRYPHHRYQSCPQIWADGFLRIHKATFELGDGTTQTVVVNERYKSKSAKISKEVKASLRQLLPLDSKADDSDTDDSDADDTDADGLDMDGSLLGRAKFLAQVVKVQRHP